MHILARTLLLYSLGLGACAGASSPTPSEQPAPAPEWSVTWSSATDTDHGDGVWRGTQAYDITITATETLQVATSLRPCEPHGKPCAQNERRAVARLAPPTRKRAKALALLLKLLSEKPRLGGTYRLSDYVDDEGGHSESITIRYEGKQVTFGFEQGRNIRQAPTEVAKLYELVTGRPLPAHATAE